MPRVFGGKVKNAALPPTDSDLTRREASAFKLLSFWSIARDIIIHFSWFLRIVDSMGKEMYAYTKLEVAFVTALKENIEEEYKTIFCCIATWYLTFYFLFCYF
jgi:hypothetical protein